MQSPLANKMNIAQQYCYAHINIIEHKGAVLMLGDASMSYMGEKIELAKDELKILQLLLGHKRV